MGVYDQETVAGAAQRPLWAKHPTRGWICCQTDHKKQLLWVMFIFVREQIHGESEYSYNNTFFAVLLRYTQLRGYSGHISDLVYNLPDLL